MSCLLWNMISWVGGTREAVKVGKYQQVRKIHPISCTARGKIAMKYHSAFAVVLSVVLIGGCGDRRDVSPHMYTGVFEVRNESQIAIREVEFSGFGGACPVGKHYRPGRSSIARFPPQSRLPEKSTVTWIEENVATPNSQELVVANNIPRGQNGSIVFRFSSQKIWITQFDPKLEKQE